jgi:ATP-dependent Clp protease adaptor protein ClpS
MMEVHRKGRSIVASGSKEQVERHAVAMHGFGLWATVEKATGGSGGKAGKSGGPGQGKGKRG